MSQSNGSIIVTSDTALANRLVGMLGDDEALSPCRTCKNLSELRSTLSRGPVDLALVDISNDPETTLVALALVTDENPRTRFIVIAAEFDKQQLFQSMQAGARHFLPKDWVTPDILPVCRELAEQTRLGGDDTGTVVTVLSAGGGCGATTVAVNLAAELVAGTEQRAVLADLDGRYGGLASHLALNGEYGLADVMARDDALDPELVRSTAVRHGESIDVLLNPVSIEFERPAEIPLERLEQAVAVLRGAYPVVVVDAPGASMETASMLAGASDLTLVVTQLSVRDLRVARSMLTALGRRVDAAERVWLVCNRHKKHGGAIALDDARKTLQFEGEVVTLPDDAQSALRSLNAGISLAEAAPKGQLRKQIAALAGRIAALNEADEEENETPLTRAERKRERRSKDRGERMKLSRIRGRKAA